MFGSVIKPNSIERNKLNIYRELHHFGGNLFRKFSGEGFTRFWIREKKYILFQEYLPDNEFDTRVTVIGNRAFAFRRFNRKKDFKASGSGEIDYDISLALRCF